MSIQTLTSRSTTRKRIAEDQRVGLDRAARRSARGPRASPATVLESLALVARELDVDLARRDRRAPPSPRRSRSGHSWSVFEHESGRRRRASGRPRPRSPWRPAVVGLATGEHGLDELLPQFRSRVAEPERQAGRSLRRSASIRPRLAQGRRLALDVALVPEREREQAPELAAQRSSRPATWSSSRRVTASGRKKPCRRSVSGESVSRANGSSSPRSHAAAGIENPRFRP